MCRLRIDGRRCSRAAPQDTHGGEGNSAVGRSRRELLGQCWLDIQIAGRGRTGSADLGELQEAHRDLCRAAIRGSAPLAARDGCSDMSAGHFESRRDQEIDLGHCLER